MFLMRFDSSLRLIISLAALATNLMKGNEGSDRNDRRRNATGGGQSGEDGVHGWIRGARGPAYPTKCCRSV